MDVAASTAQSIAEETLIGTSLTVQGDLTSAGDLLIKGVVDGHTSAIRHSVTVCREGRVRGHIFAATIIVEGRMRGNLYAEERVILKASADVLGKIFAPRVSLAEGGLFKGRINMDSKARRVAAARTNARRDQ